MQSQPKTGGGINYRKKQGKPCNCADIPDQADFQTAGHPQAARRGTRGDRKRTQLTQRQAKLINSGADWEVQENRKRN
jgi:hypothetical protein